MASSISSMPRLTGNMLDKHDDSYGFKNFARTNSLLNIGDRNSGQADTYNRDFIGPTKTKRMSNNEFVSQMQRPGEDFITNLFSRNESNNDILQNNSSMNGFSSDPVTIVNPYKSFG